MVLNFAEIEEKGRNNCRKPPARLINKAETLLQQNFRLMPSMTECKTCKGAFQILTGKTVIRLK